MTNAEIIKCIKYCMLDHNCNECPYRQYGKTCLYIDVMKFLPPITPYDCNICKYPNICENYAHAIEDRER